MANKNLKGITLQIGADTRNLQTSLDQVNRRSKELQQELREVQNGLRLDPSNVTLVSQQQELLTRSIANTSEKLTDLKNAQAQVEQQFRNGNIGEEQYRAFQREISNTEAQLRNYQTQLGNTEREQQRLGESQRNLQTFLEATGRSVEGLSSELGTNLAQAIQRGSASADQLDRALNTLARQSGFTAQQTQELRQSLSQVGQGNTLDNVRRDIERIGNASNESAKSAKDLAGELQGVALGASAAIGALGAGSIASAAQLADSASKIQASLGLTREEAERLELVSRDLFRRGFGESLEDANNSLIEVRQNIKNVNEEDLGRVTQSAIALAKQFDADVNEVTRAANNLIVNFGIESEKAFDLLAYGAQNGANFSKELFDNVAEYSGLFRALGFTSDEYFNTLVNGTQQGIYNLDFLNDIVKEFGIRIKDGSDATSDALAQLLQNEGLDDFILNLAVGGKATQEFQDLILEFGTEGAATLVEGLQKGGKAAVDAADTLRKTYGEYGEFTQALEDGTLRGADALQILVGKILELESPTERATLGVTLFGVKWEDLEELGVSSLASIDSSIENLGGSIDGIVDIQENTFGQRWLALLREATIALQPLGNVLLTLAEQWLPRVISAVTSLATWFSNLSPLAQGIVVVFGAITTILGPLIVVFGAIINAVNVIIPIFVRLAPLVTNVGGTFAALSNPITAAIAAISLITTGLLTLYNQSETVRNAINGLGRGIISTFQNVYNTVGKLIDGIVGFFKRLGGQKVDIQANVRGTNLEGVQYNALGGVFSKPTLLNSTIGPQVVGEVPGQSEAIIPLTADVLGGIGKGIAEQMRGFSGGNVTVPVYLDGREIARVVSNNQANNTSSMSLLRGVKI